MLTIQKIQMLAISTIKRRLTSALINRMEKVYQAAKRRAKVEKTKFELES